MSTNEIWRNELSRRRFTDSAQRVLRHVGERALDRGMRAGELTEATAGMLAVLSIVRWERKVGRAALERLAIDLCKFGQAVDEAIAIEGEGSRRPGGPYVVTMPSGQKGIILDAQTPSMPLLNRAELEARNLQHDWVGTEHLLLAAISLACNRFQRVLEEYGVSHNSLQLAVLEVLRPA
jgi:hypothetical protein